MIIFTIIGALIGAGFASGQEIYLFFYRFGKIGIAGIAICSILIGFVIYKTLSIIYKYKVSSYKEFLDIIFKNNKISFAINIIVNAFLCMTFFIMVSGFGAYFEQESGLNKMVGSSILAIISYIVFFRNIDKLAKINSIVVPALILCIFVLGVKNLFYIKISDIYMNVEIKNCFVCFIQSIIYASYNLILLIPVLINLNKFIVSKKQIMKVATSTGIILFIISILIFLLLINADINFENLEMPIVYVIKNKFSKFRILYGFIILIAIFTTAVSEGISFLNNICKSKKSYPQFATILCITSVIISNFGFSNLVKILFPLFGYLGLVQICFIAKVRK